MLSHTQIHHTDTHEAPPLFGQCSVEGLIVNCTTSYDGTPDSSRVILKCSYDGGPPETCMLLTILLCAGHAYGKHALTYHYHSTKEALVYVMCLVMHIYNR